VLSEIGLDSQCVANERTGSGCVAALEAEKWLADHDDNVSNELDVENQAEKSQVNGVVPEYRSNPLL
jgi:thioredoxin reductase (NADPH)